MVGTGKGAELGILIKKSESLERAGQITTVVLDKTGTITRGKPAITKIVLGTFPDGENELLRLAASAETGSEHPLGEALTAEANARSLSLSEPLGFKAVSGHGVQAEVKSANTVILVAIDGTLAGVIGVADTVKEGSLQAIASLHEMGLKVAMVTGDNLRTAQAIADQVGVDQVMAEVLPGERPAGAG